MNLLSLIVIPVLLCFTSAPARAAEAKAAAEPDLKLVQGQWERELSASDKDAGLRRAVKEIKGNKETVTFYGESDKVLRRHTVDFTVAKKGEIHVFTYSNMEITEGEGKGTKSTDSFSYVYRADEESFFEVAGLLPGEEQQPVTVVQWKRVRK